jgi:hypothetical protein
MTEFNLNKGSERLDEYMSMKLLEKAAEYKKKVYVLNIFIKSIIQRKKFKKANLTGYLAVIEEYFDVLMTDESAAQSVKRALYVIEDNLKPGNKDYDSDRDRLN